MRNSPDLHQQLSSAILKTIIMNRLGHLQKPSLDLLLNILMGLWIFQVKISWAKQQNYLSLFPSVDPVCLFRGHLLRERDSVQNNWNQCKCQVCLWVSKSKLGCMEVVCTSNQCMLQEQAIKEMKVGEDMNPANVSEFLGKTLEEGINGKLGAEKPDISAALKVCIF